MKPYKVTLFGETFEVEADYDYDARKKAAIEYRRQHGGPEPLAYLRSKTSVKLSDPRFDTRVRYPISA